MLNDNVCLRRQEIGALLDAIDSALRGLIYARFARTAIAPLASELADELGKSPSWISERLTRLAARRIVVLDERGEIAKALPFSAAPTPFVVHAGGVRYHGNCAWDAFGLAALMGPSSRIDLRCGDCDEPIDLSRPALVHFAVAAADWWADIFHT